MPYKSPFLSPLTEKKAESDKTHLCLPLDKRILSHVFNYDGLNFEFHTQNILSPVSENKK